MAKDDKPTVAQAAEQALIAKVQRLEAENTVLKAENELFRKGLPPELAQRPRLLELVALKIAAGLDRETAIEAANAQLEHEKQLEAMKPQPAKANAAAPVK